MGFPQAIAWPACRIGRQQTGTPPFPTRCASEPSEDGILEEGVMGKGILLWLLGIPLPIIILLLLFWH